jgi:hypothetical protein
MIPLMKGDGAMSRLEAPDSIRAMNVGYTVAARAWEGAAEFVAAELTWPGGS